MINKSYTAIWQKEVTNHCIYATKALEEIEVRHEELSQMVDKIKKNSKANSYNEESMEEPMAQINCSCELKWIDNNETLSNMGRDVLHNNIQIDNIVT